MNAPFIIGCATWLWLLRAYLVQFFANRSQKRPQTLVKGMYKEFFLKILLVLIAGFCFSFTQDAQHPLYFVAGVLTINGGLLMYRIYKLL